MRTLTQIITKTARTQFVHTKFKLYTIICTRFWCRKINHFFVHDAQSGRRQDTFRQKIFIAGCGKYNLLPNWNLRQILTKNQYKTLIKLQIALFDNRIWNNMCILT